MKGVEYTMKKNWMNAEVEELSLQMTENGQSPSDNFDDVWVQIGGKWYRPGDGIDTSTN